MTGIVGNGGTRRSRRWRIVAWTGAALVLALPFFAMQFSEQVQWDAADFVLFGAMLVAAGGTFELAARASGNTAYRVAVGVALAAAFVLLWANAAVGIIGSEDNPANLLAFGVIAVGVVGACIARFRPAGMARALLATAVAQGLVGLIALDAATANAIAASALFVALWLLSAWLFRQAARAQTGPGRADATA